MRDVVPLVVHVSRVTPFFPTMLGSALNCTLPETTVVTAWRWIASGTSWPGTVTVAVSVNTTTAAVRFGAVYGPLVPTGNDCAPFPSGSYCITYVAGEPFQSRTAELPEGTDVGVTVRSLRAKVDGNFATAIPVVRFATGFALVDACSRIVTVHVPG